MMNYLNIENLHGVTVTHYLDTLGDVHTDVSGAAQIVGNMAVSARRGVVIEAEQLELLGDVLTLASEALGGLLFDASSAHESKQLSDDA